MNNDIKRAEKIFKALSDKNRLRILKILQRKQGACVCEIQYILTIGQSATSKHLRILEEAGLIFPERRGKWTNYYFEKYDGKDLPQAVLTLLSSLLEDDSQIREDMKRIQKVRREDLCV